MRRVSGENNILALSGEDHKRKRGALVSFLKPEALKEYVGKMDEDGSFFTKANHDVISGTRDAHEVVWAASMTHMDETIFPNPSKIDPTRFEQQAPSPPYSVLWHSEEDQECVLDTKQY
ncbi:hypothetical protein LOK49_LG09G01596 [Camellia lanceoleosa]|uniref:Uncharacterized protein n=1 Tax=Camellia lanceoleosa TaxID=1840588 RepID=A0ACC0GHH2_9ERIC|nr:hypothetical protein LOK49_LG09G01596 [Camellia lanceoleosa]